MNRDYYESVMFLNNETEDGYGYVLSKSQRWQDIYVMFWAKETKPVFTSYLSKHHMYERAKVFVVSGLTAYSPNHIASYKMFQAFIDWYEQIV